MARQTHARGLDWQMFIMPFDCRARLRGRLPASRPHAKRWYKMGQMKAAKSEITTAVGLEMGILMAA